MEMAIPEIEIDHLLRMTDDTGLLQHAKYIIPERLNGYCTDDNSRALIFTTKYYKGNPSPEILKLFEIYLSFLYHSIKPNKTIHNFLEYDRRWRKDEPHSDAIGRAIWAFGTAIADCPNEGYIPMIKEFFNDTLNHLEDMSPRAKAYAMLGIAEFLNKFPDNERAIKLLKAGADTLCRHYNDTSTKDWQWYENSLAYANSIMPAAMFEAARILKDENFSDIAKVTCEFMIKHTFNGTHFSFIGSNGWHEKGEERAQFDQQPIEAAYTVIMMAKAYETTKDKKYLSLQRKAFEWFLGENDLHQPLYDPKTKGCKDGICKHGVNINQGAESLVSYLLARLYLKI